VPGKSLVFATLEVCLCVLVRHMPALNPSLPPASALSTPVSTVKQSALSDGVCQLLASTLQTMAELPSLCSPAGWHFVVSYFIKLPAKYRKLMKFGLVSERCPSQCRSQHSLQTNKYPEPFALCTATSSLWL
jgi:hypothetical protein